LSGRAEGFGWLIAIGDAMAGGTGLARNIVGPGRTSITIPFDEPQKAHWLDDADVGDKLRSSRADRRAA
jgi:hypothetical protein